jgi:flavin-dependent dehydrogenase
LDIRLNDGDRVCIVGGGPAGSFSALHLLEMSKRQGLKLEVLIFEARHFSLAGQGGCKGCAGLLSSRLISGLESLRIILPKEVIQSELRSYSAHIDGELLTIKQPNPFRRIYAIYRGSGPRLSSGGIVRSFDAFLLAQACERGVRHVPNYVRKITAGEKPTIYTDREAIQADLLVLASGVNHIPSLEASFGYQPPKTESMAQNEILRPASWPDGQVDVFFNQPPGLVFGALVPKGPYLSISLLGSGLNVESISDFLKAHHLDERGLSSSTGLCGCLPRVAVSSAKNYFGDRWLTVGDAAVTRLYKDGIGSAYRTAQAAMRISLEKGISKTAFQQYYAPVVNAIAWDNLYGRLSLKLWKLTIANPLLLRGWKKAIQREVNLPTERQIHHRILWGMFTGDEPYRDLFTLFFRWPALTGLYCGFFLP